jgi:hypothetical protein
MGITNKIIAGAILGAGTLAVIAYFNNIVRAQGSLQVIPNGSIYKLGLDGLTIRVDALLKNPTGAGFKIKYPFIKVAHKEVIVGSSQSIDKDITIPAYGQVMIQGMMVKIPALNFFTVGYDVVKSLLQHNPITFTIEVVTTVDLGWKQIAYEHKQELTLKK